MGRIAAGGQGLTHPAISERGLPIQARRSIPRR
ncbi:hypothetical protein RHECNPAF_1340022 [Rhizobium etli CNPAF512]|nr:hypothetical protein RHECNPAF_1340022 [Rhizobium etli CNPAF512]